MVVAGGCADDLICMYDKLHEADISKFVMSVDSIVNDYYRQSPIARFRAYANLTQTMLAEKSGINVRIIQCYEQGMRDVRKAQFETVLKLAKALECEPEDLYG